MATVLRHSIDADGNIVGTFDNNPNVNTHVYGIEFPDGAVKQHTAHVITENVLMQVCLLDKLVLHNRMGNAVSSKNAYIRTKRGFKKL